jgi:hypothetical protein
MAGNRSVRPSDRLAVPTGRAIARHGRPGKRQAVAQLLRGCTTSVVLRDPCSPAPQWREHRACHGLPNLALRSRRFVDTLNQEGGEAVYLFAPDSTTSPRVPLVRACDRDHRSGGRAMARSRPAIGYTASPNTLSCSGCARTVLRRNPTALTVFLGQVGGAGPRGPPEWRRVDEATGTGHPRDEGGDG